MGRFDRKYLVESKCKLQSGAVVTYEIAYDHYVEMSYPWRYLGAGRDYVDGKETGSVKHFYKRV